MELSEQESKKEALGTPKRGAQQSIEELERENTLLRAELWAQWELNHSEHCGNQWPHPAGRICCYPLPSVLLVTLASEASRLRFGEGDRYG